MTIISGCELCLSDSLLWTAQVGGKQLRVVLGEGVQVEGKASDVYRASALPIASATSELATVYLKPSRAKRVWHVRLSDTHPFEVYPQEAAICDHRASDCGGFWSRRYAQLAIVKPPAYIRTLRRTMLGSYESSYLALSPSGAVYRLGNKREVLLLAKTGEPIAAHLVKVAGWLSDAEDAWT